jgi:hypothetical protein
MAALDRRNMGHEVAALTDRLNRLYEWAFVEGAALEDARHAFLQTLSMLVRETELRRQLKSVQSALAEAVSEGHELEGARLVAEIRAITDQLGNLDRLEALADGFGVSSGRGRGRT